jgi:hypothetical protein
MNDRIPPTSVYLLPELKAELVEAAKADRRSLSSLVSIIAREWLDQQPAKPKRRKSRA